MLIAIPLMIVPVALYGLVVLFAGQDPGGPAVISDAMGEILFGLNMASGARWTVTVGDLILLLSLCLLFVELLRSAASQRTAVIKQALSMILFVVCLVQFLLLPGHSTSVFFLILTMVLLEVLAGFIVSIGQARGDGYRRGG